VIIFWFFALKWQHVLIKELAILPSIKDRGQTNQAANLAKTWNLHLAKDQLSFDSQDSVETSGQSG